MRDGQSNWEPVDDLGRPLTPVATPEWKRPNLASIYALNKYVQERTTHIMSAPYGIEGVCLRLFNVYGPGQALSNPYTGVLAIFASRSALRRTVIAALRRTALRGWTQDHTVADAPPGAVEVLNELMARGVL